MRASTNLSWILWGCACSGVSQAFFPVSLPLSQDTLLRLAEKAASTVYEGKKKVPKKVVVIGGGWAGFSAADALATANTLADGNNGDEPVLEIEILDASPRGPGGLAGGWRTPKLNRPVEAGLHGFWREYRNTFAAIERIGLGLDDVLTPYTPSMLISKSGNVAVAPVLGEAPSQTTASAPELLKDPSDILKRVSDLLPPPLDVALLSDFDDSNPLTTVDRLSALGLLGVWADFEQENPESWKKYDKISADNLFRVVAGVSPTLYDELVAPLLHVLPMTPGYDCSAAAALSCFHVFALQARGAFDVRWCRGTISEQIFNPWAEKLLSSGAVQIRGAARVTCIEELDSEENSFRITVNDEDTLDCDAIVLAVGGTALKRLVPASPLLSQMPESKGWENFRGVTCVAVRLFLKPCFEENSQKASMIPPIARGMKDSPVAVCGPGVGDIPELAETGFCIYDLQRLQDEFELSNEAEDGKVVESVGLEVDFFRADDLASIENDNEVAELTLNAVSEALGIEKIDPDLILDLSVVRARDAVSHFCVNSASWSPGVKLQEGVYICGDWIDRTGHASWSTEKAVVTARQAVEALATDFELECQTEVIPAAADSAQLTALRRIARTFRSIAPFDILPPAPWVLAKQFSRR